MAFFFARRWRFSLTLEALTDVHIGTGQLEYVESDDERRQVMVQAKDVTGKAYIPSTAFKGAVRATGYDAGLDVDALFGNSGDNETSRAGRLVFFGAVLKQPGEMADMPECNMASGTYSRPQHARDRESRTVLPKYLYHVENIPRSTTFTLNGVFFDDGIAGDDGIAEVVMPILNRMATMNGFSVGANKTMLGQMRLTDEGVNFCCEKVKRKESDVEGRTHIEVKTRKFQRVLPISPQPAAASVVERITCPGPFLVADPSRTGRAATTCPGRAEVISELRYKKGQPSGWERAIRQSLRSLSGYLEATLDKNSGNRIDDPFVAYTSFDSLCSTQRLFGVEGFRGLLSLHVLSTENKDRGCFPGLELDALTQGSLEHAAFVIGCPVGGELEIAFGIDKARYERLLEKLDDRTETMAHDVALVSRLNEYVTLHGLQAGAKVTRGYGWFVSFNMGIDLEVSESA